MRSVRWRYPLISAAVAVAFSVPLVVLLARGPASSGEDYRGSRPPKGIAAPEFELRSYTGALVRMRELRGKAVAVTFLDTQCTEACPIVAAEIGRALDLLPAGSRGQVAALAISVDPDEDTPRRVRSFLRRQRAERALDYLIGPEKELARVWEAFKIVPSVETGDDEIHSAPVRVFDPEGTWVATLHAGVDLTGENLAHDLRVALG